MWHGNLYLRGGGDPTFGDPTFNRTWEFGYGPTAAQLTEQLVKRGITRVTGQIFADETMFDRKRGGLMTNYLPDVPDFGGQLSALTYDHGATVPHYSPAAFAARELALVMRGSHIAVKAVAPRARRPRTSAKILATVSSPPLSVMTRLMDVPSDDLFAELFAKQLGVLFGRGGSISDGAAGHRPHDGRHLRPAPEDPRRVRAVTQRPLLAAGGRRPAARGVGHAGGASSWWRRCPPSARRAPCAGIGLKTAAVGNCAAKTGTLNYVTNLAGYCRSRGGHTLAFALFMRRPGQRHRRAPGEPDDRRDRSLLTSVALTLHNRRSGAGCRSQPG